MTLPPPLVTNSTLPTTPDTCHCDLQSHVETPTPQIKLAISYALAQSTKLSLHERRVTDMVLETKHLPESLAASGKVSLSPETIAKLIGKVFIQKVCAAMVGCVALPGVVWCVQGRGRGECLLVMLRNSYNLCCL